MKKLILIALVVTCFACAKATNDTGRALDNANSVIKSGDKKIWNTAPDKGCQCKDCEHKGKDCSCNSGCACGKDKDAAKCGGK